MFSVSRKQELKILNLEHFRTGSSVERNTFVKEFGHAFQELGFVAIDQHGLEPAFMQQCYDAAYLLFDLPKATKQNYSKLEIMEQPRGYMVLSPESDNPDYQSYFKESWHIGPEVPAASTYKYASNIWPKEVQQLNPLYSRLYKDLEKIAFELLEASSIYFGEAKDFFRKKIEYSMSLLRILHYPEIPQAMNQSRMVPHTDLSIITLLYEPNMAGLEIERKDGSWIKAPNRQGLLFINVGELLSYITRDFFYCAHHRVVTTKPGRRISLPMFIIPRPDVVLTTAKTTGQYLMERIPQLPRY